MPWLHEQQKTVIHYMKRLAASVLCCLLYIGDFSTDTWGLKQVNATLTSVQTYGKALHTPS